MSIGALEAWAEVNSFGEGSLSPRLAGSGKRYKVTYSRAESLYKAKPSVAQSSFALIKKKKL